MLTRYTPRRRRQSSWLVPRPILSALWARSGLLVFVGLAVFAVIGAILYTTPKRYESRMELLLTSDASLFSFDPSSRSLARSPYLHDTLVNSEIELLRSNDVLTKVVLKTGLQKLETGDDQFTGETSPLTLEKALHRLRQNLKITPVRESNVLQISYAAGSPEIASAVLKALGATYPGKRVEIRSQPGTYRFLQQQSVAWRTALVRAESDLVRYRKMYSGFVLPEERAAFGKRAVEAQTAAEQAEAQVAEYEQKVYRQQQELALYTARPLGHTHGGSNPRIVPVQYQPNGVNEADLSAMHRDLLMDRAQLSGLHGLQGRLKQVAARYRHDMLQMAEAAVQHDALQRQVKQNEDRYLLYSRKQEETRIAQALARGQVSDVSIADGPTQPVEPSSPLIGQDLLWGALCSLACGIAVVLLVEFFTAGHLRTYEAVRSMTIDV